MSFTPGPWIVVDELTVKGGAYGDRRICDVHHDFKRRGKDGAALWENSKANANLIAAAPSLLQGCQLALSVAKNHDAAHVVIDENDTALGDFLRSVIEKAEGKS